MVLGKPKGAARSVLGAASGGASVDGAAVAEAPKTNTPALASDFDCSALRSSMSLGRARRFLGPSGDPADSENLTFEACPKPSEELEGGMDGGAGAVASLEWESIASSFAFPASVLLPFICPAKVKPNPGAVELVVLLSWAVESAFDVEDPNWKPETFEPFTVDAAGSGEMDLA